MVSVASRAGVERPKHTVRMATPRSLAESDEPALKPARERERERESEDRERRVGEREEGGLAVYELTATRRSHVSIYAFLDPLPAFPRVSRHS